MASVNIKYKQWEVKNTVKSYNNIDKLRLLITDKRFNMSFRMQISFAPPELTFSASSILTEFIKRYA